MCDHDTRDDEAEAGQWYAEQAAAEAEAREKHDALHDATRAVVVAAVTFRRCSLRTLDDLVAAYEAVHGPVTEEERHAPQ